MDQFSSSAWHRIRLTQPQLSPRVRVVRQKFRGEPWLVIHDRVTGKFHRCPAILNEVISLMGGDRTVEEIWRLMLTRHGDQSLTQEDMVQFIADLGRADLLVSSSGADLVEQELRRHDSLLAKIRQFAGNPVALRLPLFNPNRFLSATYDLFGWIPLPLVLLAWGGLMIAGLLVTGYYWPMIAENFVDQAFAWDNLLLIWLIFPLVKALHEMGHGLATKRRGGEVHEAGFMLLLFVPVPYIECSSASAFSNRRSRMLVGSAGMMVDLAVGALALMAWVQLEPGLLRSLLFNVMLVTWATTLLFNGNPLLRYDGYFVLSDMLEIPNLAQRANRLYGYFFQRYAAGLSDLSPPYGSVAEMRWMLAYGAASFVYRLFIAIVIALTLFAEFRPIGAVLAIWVIVMMVLVPFGKPIAFLLTAPNLTHHRSRAIGLTSVLTLLVGTGIFMIPVSSSIVVLGEVAPTDSAIVRVAQGGVVRAVHVRDGDLVRNGQLILELENLEVFARDSRLKAQTALAESKVRAALVQRDSAAVAAHQQLRTVAKESSAVAEDLDGLRLHARQSGVLQLNRGEALLGRVVDRGEVLGVVQGRQDRLVRIVLAQDRFEQISKGVIRAQALWQSASAEPYALSLQRLSAGATDELPSAVHSRAGGGIVATDPRDSRHLSALLKVFVIDLDFADPEARLPAIGSRIWVRLEHDDRTLAEIVGSWLRQRLNFR